MDKIKVELIEKRDAEVIRDIMTDIFMEEKRLWFKDGGEPFIPGYNSKEMQIYHTWNQKYFKIIFEDKIAGVLLVSHTDKEHGRVDRFYIHPDFQNKRIGSSVIKIMEDMFPNVKKWTLETMKESPRNHHFYKKVGYEVVGEDHEEIYFQKELGEGDYNGDDYITSGDFQGKNFRGCTFKKSDFYNINMGESTFSNANLAGNVYMNANVSRCRFTNTNLRGTIFGDSNMRDIELCHGAMTGGKIHDINLDVKSEDAYITIERCNIEGSEIKDSNLKGVKIEGCDIEGLTIDGIDIAALIKEFREKKQ